MKKTSIISLAFGMILGISLAGQFAQAAEAFLQARPSTQEFFVNGRRVEMEAYAINGHNYVKLRDIGKEAGFNVSYDPFMDAAIVNTHESYSDESQAVITPAPTANPVIPAADADHSAQANPAIFTGEVTRAVYNAVRDSIVHKDEIAVGAYASIPMNGVEPHGQLFQTLIMIGKQPVYQLKGNVNGEMICLPRYLDGYQAAADHCQPFIDSLAGLSDAEKVRQLDFYICDRMTYERKGADIGNILSQDGVVPSYCMNFSYCLQFLCDMADIPCILVASDVHMWSEVYVDGQWWGVDVTSDNGADEQGLRDHLEVLHPTQDFQGSIFEDSQPEVTRLAKELLVPGSTK